MTHKNKSPYIFLIILLLGSFLLFSTWSARQAANNGSRISDPAYYSKGLKYTNTQVEKQAAASQGWQLATQVEENQLRFSLSDAQQNPIGQASGNLTLYLSAEKQLLHLLTREAQPGEYLVDLPSDLHGSHQARIEFVRAGARISRQLLVNL